MNLKSWSGYAPVETALEILVPALRDVKGRMRQLFAQERTAANAGLFLDGLLSHEQRKTGWNRVSRSPQISALQIRTYGATGGEDAFSPERPTPMEMSNAPLRRPQPILGPVHMRRHCHCGGRAESEDLVSR